MVEIFCFLLSILRDLLKSLSIQLCPTVTRFIDIGELRTEKGISLVAH